MLSFMIVGKDLFMSLGKGDGWKEGILFILWKARKLLLQQSVLSMVNELSIQVITFLVFPLTFQSC